MPLVELKALIIPRIYNIYLLYIHSHQKIVTQISLNLSPILEVFSGKHLNVKWKISITAKNENQHNWIFALLSSCRAVSPSLWSLDQACGGVPAWQRVLRWLQAV